MKIVKRIFYIIFGFLLASAISLVGVILYAEYSGRQLWAKSGQETADDSFPAEESRLAYDENGNQKALLIPEILLKLPKQILPTPVRPAWTFPIPEPKKNYPRLIPVRRLPLLKNHTPAAKSNSFILWIWVLRSSIPQTALMPQTLL